MSRERILLLLKLEDSEESETTEGVGLTYRLPERTKISEKEDESAFLIHSGSTPDSSSIISCNPSLFN